MVSIFAAEIYEETLTGVSLDNGDLMNTISIDNFPLIDVSSIVGGFTYVESTTVQINITGSFDLRNIKSGFDRSWRLDVVPVYVFDDTLDLFSNVEPGTAFEDTISGETTETYTDLSVEASFNIDTYIDTPAECSAAIQFTAPSTTPLVRVEGNHTIDVEAIVSIIGRKP